MILKNCPTPRKLLDEDKEILYALVNQWSRGRKKKETVDRLTSLAEDSVGSPIDIDAIEVEIPFIVDEILFIEKKIKEIKEHIKKQGSQIEEIELLETVPGIGTVSAASIVGEITNISRFSSVKKLRAYVSIDPTLTESPGSVRGRSTISKRGFPYLRRTLYYAANASRRFSPTFKEYYKKKLSQHPDVERYAIVSVVNKLTGVIHCILKSKKPFDPSHESRFKIESNVIISSSRNI